jgi:hypothetical protein
LDNVAKSLRDVECALLIPRAEHRSNHTHQGTFAPGQWQWRLRERLERPRQQGGPDATPP